MYECTNYVCPSQTERDLLDIFGQDVHSISLLVCGVKKEVVLPNAHTHTHPSHTHTQAHTHTHTHTSILKITLYQLSRLSVTAQQNTSPARPANRHTRRMCVCVCVCYRRHLTTLHLLCSRWPETEHKIFSGSLVLVLRSLCSSHQMANHVSTAHILVWSEMCFTECFCWWSHAGNHVLLRSSSFHHISHNLKIEHNRLSVQRETWASGKGGRICLW